MLAGFWLLASGHWLLAAKNFGELSRSWAALLLVYVI
jgi:hypothetical protein